jgi:ABC-type nitrate/sulfonate/bicarbonate transport system ATPase subunit
LGDRIGVMTPGPAGTIKEVLDNPLPRPRAQMSAEFVGLFNHLQASLGVTEHV